MPNLEKVVKLTQLQYTTLEGGGTVGDYTGLDDSYLYLVQDNNEYLPTTGGTINGELTINNQLTTPFKINYDNDNNYFIEINADSESDTSKYSIDVEEINGTNYELSLPAKSGILATRSDIPTNYVTTDTAQTITGAKTFSQTVITPGITSNGTYLALQGVDGALTLGGDLAQFNVKIVPTRTTQDIGSSTRKWKDLYLSGKIYLNDSSGTNSGVTFEPKSDGGTFTAHSILIASPYLYTYILRPYSDNLYDLGSSAQRWKDLYVSGNAIFSNPSASKTWSIYQGNDGELYFYSSATASGQFAMKLENYATSFYQVYPVNGTGDYNLGSSGKRWNNLYLRGNLTDGTNSISVANIVNKQDALVSGTNIKTINNTSLLGSGDISITDTNYYPTSFSWTNGTTAGPTGALSGSGMSSVSIGAIPSASASQSGIVTTGTQAFAGEKDFDAIYAGGVNQGEDWFSVNSNGINFGNEDNDFFLTQNTYNILKITDTRNGYEYTFPDSTGTLMTTSDAHITTASVSTNSTTQTRTLTLTKQDGSTTTYTSSYRTAYTIYIHHITWYKPYTGSGDGYFMHFDIISNSSTAFTNSTLMIRLYHTLVTVPNIPCSGYVIRSNAFKGGTTYLKATSSTAITLYYTQGSTTEASVSITPSSTLTLTDVVESIIL